MATGLLIVCCGKATKQVDLYQAMDKLYTGTLKLGEATPSYDAETEVEERLPWEHVTDAQVVDAAATFLGQIDQVRTTSPFQASMCSTRENSPSTPSSSPNRAFGDCEAALTGGLDGCDAAASHVLGDKGGREAAVQGGGKASGGLDARTYDINITGGSITIANNVTYVTPETLGVIDKSIGSFTGARTITGSLTCYLDTKSNGSNQLLSDMAAATDLVSNVFNMSLFMGGASSAVPVVEFDIPKAHMQVPTLETGDLISTSVEFSAHGTDLLTGDEMAVKYKGLTTHSDSQYTTDYTV
jgi:hypothetical protein